MTVIQWRDYKKKAIQPMRPYIPGEDMTKILVARGDILEPGGMIAANPKDPTDLWYVSKQLFEDTYEPA